MALVGAPECPHLGEAQQRLGRSCAGAFLLSPLCSRFGFARGARRLNLFGSGFNQLNLGHDLDAQIVRQDVGNLDLGRIKRTDRKALGSLRREIVG